MQGVLPSGQDLFVCRENYFFFLRPESIAFPDNLFYY